MSTPNPKKEWREELKEKIRVLEGSAIGQDFLFDVVCNFITSRDEALKKDSWVGWTCVLGTVRYSPIFDRKEDATNYPQRPKGTEVVKVYAQSEEILALIRSSREG